MPGWLRRLFGLKPALECYDHGWYITFNRSLTADETLLMQFTWDRATSGAGRPDSGWTAGQGEVTKTPAKGSDRHGRETP